MGFNRGIARQIFCAFAIVAAATLSNPCYAALTNIRYTRGEDWNMTEGWPIKNGVIDFSEANYFSTNVTPNINFWNGESNFHIGNVEANFFGHQWLGYINITLPGNYGFGTISDDGSQVWVDGKLIVDNRERQWFDWEDNISEGNSPDDQFSPLYLEEGMHTIEVRFYEQQTWSGIELWWLLPGSGPSRIPYLGTSFHDVIANHPELNPNRNWQIVPESVLTAFDFNESADFDFDGVLGSGDIAQWSKGYGLSGPGVGRANGDADRDRDVDGRDFLRWQRGTPDAITALTSVPEPSSSMLGFACACLLVLRRVRYGRT